MREAGVILMKGLTWSLENCVGMTLMHFGTDDRRGKALSR